MRTYSTLDLNVTLIEDVSTSFLLLHKLHILSFSVSISPLQIRLSTVNIQQSKVKTTRNQFLGKNGFCFFQHFEVPK